MKHRNGVIVFAVLALLLSNIMAFGVSLRTVKADTQNMTIVQFNNIGGGLTSLTSTTTHASAYAAKLVIPSNAPQGSGCMVLYPCNEPLNSLQSFQVYTSYTNASPRFVILLDTNGDGLPDVALLSDYQFTSNGNWQITQGGQRWGWTEASPQLSTYGKTWSDFNFWKGIYGNATVLSVGIALEYWAVKDSNGLDQPLYADELVLNSVTYNIALPLNQPLAIGSPTDDWLMFHHDTQRTGSSMSAASDNSLLWQFSTGDKIRSSAAIVNGIVYDGSNNGYVYALNATSGSVIWQYKSASNVESSPAVVGNVVYIGILWDSHNGYVIALNASTGSVIWRYATNSGIESSPTVVNGVVYVGSYFGYIYALNATNGALIWSYLTGGFVFSSPVVVYGIAYVGSSDGYVYALDAANGQQIWSFHTGGKIYSSPSVVENVVYIGSDDDNVYALKAIDGSEVWRYTTGGYVETSPAIAGGIVYVGSNDGYVSALNATNGMRIWSFHSPYSSYHGYVYSSPAVAGAVVYVGSYDGYVFALNASNASIIWSYRTGNFVFSSPTVMNGVVYIGSFDGKIYALGNPTVPTLHPTPMPTPEPTFSPVPVNTSKPTETPNVIVTPMTTSTLSQAISPISIAQPATRPMLSDKANENESINWIIFGSITGTEAIALISLVLFFKKDH